MTKFLKHFPLTKVDVAKRIVYGIVTAEREDTDGEVCDYDTTKPEYQKVNQDMAKASDGENIMPLREMHQLKAVGAGKTIDFDDDKREISMSFKVVEDSTWQKVLEKVLLGFSQGGRYVKRWRENGKSMFTARPGEVSLVDRPAVPGALIEYIKADGSVENFETPPASELDTTLEKFYARLSRLVGQLNANEGVDAMKPEDIKKCAAALGITEAEFIKTYVEGDVLAKGKKGLAALGAHLKKAMAHHAKLKTFHSEHADLHKAHAAAHGVMGDHMENCMKAYDAASEGDETEKVLKALVDSLGEKPEVKYVSIGKSADGVEVFKLATEEKTPKIATEETLTKAQATTMIADAVKTALEEFKKSLPDPDDPARKVRLVTRGDGVKKADSQSAIPV